jgi:glycerol-3-phosphate dehydrogenase
MAAEESYDLVIIGGGINGAGIARDAASRGIRLLLLEMNDFASGTTSWSSRLIHGGLRYLEHGELGLVYESLQERGRLLRTARHLVKRIRINVPVYQGSKRGMLTLRIGMLAYDLLSFGKPLPAHRMLDRRAFLANEPGVAADGLKGGAQYFDAQVTFAERLVMENLAAARAYGADIRNYTTVTGIDIDGGKVRAVRYADEDGREHEVGARVVVNAAGPWVDHVLATVNRRMPELTGGTKGSHIVVGAFEGAPRDAFYVEAYVDARPFFIIPWNGQYLIGTTDHRYRGDPADASPSEAEIDYLLSETNRVFPRARLTRADIHYAYAGVRPLPAQATRKPESSITRRHIIRHHQRNALGLLSVVGGKLTTYRRLAEQVTDRVVKLLGVRAKACVTREMFLPGALGTTAAEKMLAELGTLSPAGAARLLSVYGGRTRRVLEIAFDEPALDVTLDRERTVLAAEVAFAVRHELARHLTDIVHRRTMVGLSPDQGEALAERMADVAARELGWDAKRKAEELAALRAWNARRRVARP